MSLFTKRKFLENRLISICRGENHGSDKFLSILSTKIVAEPWTSNKDVPKWPSDCEIVKKINTIMMRSLECIVIMGLLRND